MSHKLNELYEALKRGYAEMSEINSDLAKEGVAADNEALEHCEDNLTECE